MDDTVDSELHLTNGKLRLNDEKDDKDDYELLMANGRDCTSDPHDTLVLRQPTECQLFWRFDKLARPVCFVGFLCLLLGLTIVGIGIASFIIIPTFKTAHSFQVESKWTNLLLIFGGLCAVFLTVCRNLALICGTLIFSLIASVFALSTAAIHVANYYFRLLDINYYEMYGNKTEMDRSESVGNIYLSLAAVSGISCIMSLVLFTIVFYLVGKNYGFKLHLGEHSLRLTVMGLIEIVAGLLITGLWVAVETLFAGQGVNLHALPSSEVLSHGLIILCAGAVQMLAMGKGTRPLLLCATVMQGLTFIVTTFYGERPMSVMAFSLDSSQSMLGGNAVFESRMAVCIMLGAAYMLTMLLSMYCFGKFLHITSNNRVPRLDNLADHSRRRLRLLSYVQCILALVYAVVDIMAIGLFLMYKLDFTPLPLFILAQGIFTYFALHNRSPLMLSVGVVVGTFCAVYSIRDIYLFVYHVTVAATPDSISTVAMSGAKLSVHLCLVTVAIVEICVSLWLTIISLRVMMSCIRIAYNRVEVSFSLYCLRVIGVIKICVSLSIIAMGFMLFLGSALFVETFGDLSITKGVLMLVTSSLLLLQEKRPVLLLYTLFMQIFLFTLILMQADSLAYFIDNHLGLPEDSAKTELILDLNVAKQLDTKNQHSITLSFVNFALFLFHFLSDGIAVLLLARVLEICQFNVREIDGDREEMITIKSQNFL